MPQIGGVDISAAAVFDEAFCVDFREPFDLAQPEAQRITIAADPSLSPLKGGEGFSPAGSSGSRVQSHWLKLMSAGHTSTPCSRASRTICAGA